MKIENVVIYSDEQKVYYINYANKISEALKCYEERKNKKVDIKNYSRAYRFFMSTDKC